MPSYPTGFAALALYPGIIDADAFIFLEQNTGNSALLDAYLRLQDGSSVPLYSIRDTKSLLYGSGAPTSGIGESGDFYIDSYNNYIYGPKTGDSVSWPTGTSLVGPSGAQGATTAVTGETGPTGAPGSGVATGGVSGQILYKTSSSDYATSWIRPRNLLEEYKLYRFSDYNFTVGSVLATYPSTSSSLGSSVTYSPITNSLYIADNAAPAIHEFDLNGGTSYRKITLSGFSDVEAIDWMHDTTFVIAEEGNPTIVNELSVITIPKKEDVTIIKSGANWIRTIDTNVDSVSNKGIEGVAYNPYDNYFYFVTEYGSGSTWNVWKTYNSGGSATTEVFSLTNVLSGKATDISDMHFCRQTETLVMTTDEGIVAGQDGYLLEFSLNGNLVQSGNFSDLGVSFASSNQIEGVCLSHDRSLLFVTAEGTIPLIYVFEFNTHTNPSINNRSKYLTYYDSFNSNLVHSRLSYTSSLLPDTTILESGDDNYYILSNYGIESGSFIKDSKYKANIWGTVTSANGMILSGDLRFQSLKNNVFTGSYPIIISPTTGTPWEASIDFSVLSTGLNPTYSSFFKWDTFYTQRQTVAYQETNTIPNTGSANYTSPKFIIGCISGSGSITINSISFDRV